MTRKISPMLFVWIPIGLQTGVRIEDMAWVYHLLVILAAWLMLKAVCIRQR